MAETFANGAWRQLARGEVFIGGAWRTLRSSETYKNGAWVQSASFVTPLMVIANDVTRGGFYSTSATRTVSGTSSALPSGGIAPYSYSWVILSGPATVGSPSTASTSITATIAAETQVTGAARVTVTDAVGTVANADITYSLSNYSRPGGTA